MIIYINQLIICDHYFIKFIHKNMSKMILNIVRQILKVYLIATK